MQAGGITCNGGPALLRVMALAALGEIMQFANTIKAVIETTQAQAKSQRKTGDANERNANAQAQARFRARHADQRAKVRKVTNLLSHAPPSATERALDHWYPRKPDFSDLADALCECLGSKSAAKQLRKDLLTSLNAMDD